MTRTKKQKAKARDTRQPRRIEVRAPDGSLVLVEVRSRTIYGLEEQQINAIARVNRDWEAAYCGSLKSPGFDCGVDGGQIAGGSTVALHAQNSLTRLRQHLGDRDYELLIAFCIHGIGPVEMAKIKKLPRREMSTEVKRVIAAAAAWYDPTWRMERDSMWNAAAQIAAGRA